jgi:hypothetical protein
MGVELTETVVPKSHLLLADATVAACAALQAAEEASLLEVPLENLGDAAELIAAKILEYVDGIVPDRTIAIQEALDRVRLLSGQAIAGASLAIQGFQLRDSGDRNARTEVLAQLRDARILMGSTVST